MVPLLCIQDTICSQPSHDFGKKGAGTLVALITIADAPGGVPGSPGNPEPVAGPSTFGLGDLTDALLFTWNARG